MELSIMIEGQDGLTWPRWQKIATLVEDLGFAGLYRSDHYTNAEPPEKDSLELWVSLTWLASHTKRIHFGPLVSPFGFRHPSMTARMAAAIDDLSGGRLVLGLGAGWQEREHSMFGLDLLEIPARMQRYHEGLEVVRLLLNSDQPVNFSGQFYELRDAIMLPRPQRPGGPPILVGGNGKRTLRLAAKYAKEWNGTSQTPQSYRAQMQRLDEALAAEGRQPDDMKRSAMLTTIFGRSSAEIEQRIAATGYPREEWLEYGALVGEGGQILEQLGRLAAAGCQQAMLQWRYLDDLDGIEALAKALLPHAASL